MKTTDEHGTTVYFNIPDDAVVTANDSLILIEVQRLDSSIPPGLVAGKSKFNSYLRFVKVDSCADTKLTGDRSTIYLLGTEFALLQQEVEEHFNSQNKDRSTKPPTLRELQQVAKLKSLQEVLELTKKVSDLELALDASIIQCNTLQEEVSSLQEENAVLIAAQNLASANWD